MAWIDGQVKGFNVRTDNAGAYAAIDTPPDTYLAFVGDTYSQTRNDVTFGRTTAGANTASLNADYTVNAKFAGFWYTIPGESATIRVDLPATGFYRFRLANGCTGGGAFVGYRQILTVKDDTTVRLVHDVSSGPAVDHYYDATGVDRAEADWPSLNDSVDIEFTTLICNIVIGGASASYTALAHFSLEKLAAGAPAPNIGSISPSSALGDPSNIVNVPCTLTGTSFDVQLSGGDAALSWDDPDLTNTSVVIVSATSITFTLHIAANPTAGLKILTVMTDNGSDTIGFNVTLPSGVVGINPFSSPVIE